MNLRILYKSIRLVYIYKDCAENFTIYSRCVCVAFSDKIFQYWHERHYLPRWPGLFGLVEKKVRTQCLSDWERGTENVKKSTRSIGCTTRYIFVRISPVIVLRASSTSSSLSMHQEFWAATICTCCCAITC